MLDKLRDFWNYKTTVGEGIEISVKAVLLIIALLIAVSLLIKISKKLTNRKLREEDQMKFASVYNFSKYFLYLAVLLIGLQNMGVELTAIFTASAALLLGVGLALQTFFQDIISGIFILVDRSVSVGDILEVDSFVCRVTEIKLRTTRAVTMENKVLIIPNHKYLTTIIYNWTENDSVVRAEVEVGVDYGSDVRLVESLLYKAAREHKEVLRIPEPIVLFTNFGDSSLNFKLVFFLQDSFAFTLVKSDVRFAINQLFKENNVVIPFPQRVIHMANDNK
jgi:small-conductance mechanosensitive channel